MPPRHGKSELCSRFFPAWYLGRHPDHNVILASYEGGLAQMLGEKARDVLAEFGPEVFGVGVHPKRNSAADWRVAGHGGRMRSTGLTGGVTGRGADVLIIDDPIKDAAEASSETFRNRAWDWYSATARTRLEPHAIVMVIQTRWHQEDLIGRLRHQQTLGGEAWESLTLPAIVETAEDEKNDALGRKIGEALWPWRYSAADLLAIKSGSPEHWWNALFQQRPTPPGGALAKATWFQIVSASPVDMIRRCRFWDCAGGEAKPGSDPDWTVGALVGREAGKFYIEDIVRVRETSGEVDRVIRQTAQLDGPNVIIREEQEGGSSGLAVINARRMALAGYDYRGQQALGKPKGWIPMLIQAEVGNVKMIANTRWNAAFLAEVVAAPYGRHDDQLDAVAGAFHALTLGEQKASLDPGAPFPLYF